VSGLLGVGAYVGLLALSSLLHAWGSAGMYTLVAEQLPEEDRLAGNALLSTFTMGATVVGPALAGVVTALVGPGWVIGGDALSFAVLAAAGWLAPALRAPAEAATTGTIGSVLRQRQLLGLLVVTCGFFFLYGPVEVALPIHVAKDLHGSSGLLGLVWAVFGVFAVVGGLAAGLLRDRPLWTVVVVIVIGWGVAMVPVGLFAGVGATLIGFGIGGLIYGPYTAISTALYQSTSPPESLSRVLAIATAMTTPATSFGALLGGPAVGALGARKTFVASGLLTIAFGVATALTIATSRRRE
jgi:predicted MFS family arabinose efflux permease